MPRLAFAPAALALLFGACLLPPRPGSDMPGEGAHSSGATSSPLPEHLHELPDRLLALHNREREAVGLGPLSWDARPASAAARYGPELAQLRGFIHSERQSRPGQGENLWMGTRNRYSLESMFHGWAREKALFRPGTYPRVSSSGRSSDVGHYTQIIWPGTERVGCAVYRAQEWDYLICRYAPAGNVLGQRVP